MKRIYKILAILGVGSLAWSCNDRIIVDDSSKDGDDVQFSLVTNIPASQQTKSMVSGEENAITVMQLVCFDKSGMYLGTKKAKTVTSTGMPQSGKIDGAVPTGTARIHFIGNRNLTTPLPFSSGTPEKLIMTSEALSTLYEENNTKAPVVYWGYHREETPEAMTQWLQAGLTEGSTPNKVELIRDRARIRLNVSTSAMTGYSKVEWLIHNGRDRGYIAPFDPTKDNPWENYVIDDPEEESTTPAEGDDVSVEKTRVANVPMTEYTGSGRYSLWVSEADENRAFDAATAYQYVFDDSNIKSSDSDGRIKVILKVTDNSNNVKYLVALLNDSERQQLPITRNNTYVINVNSLAHDGYPTLQAAVNGDDFANAAVEIDRTITTVNDDKYSLVISLDNGTTSVVYNATGDYNVNFKFLNVSDQQPVSGAKASDFEIKWEDKDQVDWTIGTASISDGVWSIPVHIGTIGQSNVFEDYLIIRHKASGLERYVHIYAVEKFNFPEGKAPELTKETTQFVENNKSYDVYKLTFTIPSNFAADLYPIEIKFATVTLDAYSDNTIGARSGSFGVSVESTLSLNNSTTTTNWNYDAINWGYWYIYTIKEMPADGNVTLYFRDVTSLKETKPLSVGLFLSVPNFGSIFELHQDK